VLMTDGYDCYDNVAQANKLVHLVPIPVGQLRAKR
jgi:hypothetical protein